jgi:HEAT repeat protein
MKKKQRISNIQHSTPNHEGKKLPPRNPHFMIGYWILDILRFAVSVRQTARAAGLMWLVAVLALAGGCAGEGGDRAGYLAKSRELLPQMLKSEDSSVRGFGLEIYKDLHLAAPKDSLAALVRDPEVPVRFNALALLAAQTKTVEEKAAARRVFEKILAEDEDRNVRLAAAYGLAKLGDTSQLAMLAEALEDQTDVAGRRNAAMLLGLLGNGSAATMLKEHLKDPDTMVRVNVGEAMVRLGEQSGLSALRLVALDSSSPSHQVAAILALGRVGFPPEDIHNLLELQGRHPSVGALLATFGARAMLGDYSQINFLIEVASGAAKDVRLTDRDQAFALQLLAQAAYGPAWAEAGQCLGDHNLAVVYSAAWAELAFDTPRGQKLKSTISNAQKSQMLTQGEVLRRPAPPKNPTGTGAQTPGQGQVIPGVGR